MSQQQQQGPGEVGSTNGEGKQGPAAYTRRFSDEQREHALVLVASGVRATEVARIIGTTDKSIRSWVQRATADGVMPQVPVAIPAQRPAEATGKPVAATEAAAAPGSDAEAACDAVAADAVSRTGINEPSTKRCSPYAPSDPGQGLSDVEVAAILELKKDHPSYGPAQLRAQLKRFKGWRISQKAIAKVLRDRGYELVHRGSRPQGFEPQRFEAPRRNALWQLDFTELRVAADKFFVLVALDDFSRYVVGHCFCDSAEAESAVTLVRQCMARHGKPESLRTDRGGAFTSTAFAKALEAELIDHVVGRPYHPQGGGKVESVIGTLRRELWDIEQFANREQAQRRVADFFRHYNESRAHMGIDGLTPADRYFGRADQVLARIDAMSRKRNAAAALTAPVGAPLEETATALTQAPMEVLRLAVVDGHMELRLYGARVRLGSVER